MIRDELLKVLVCPETLSPLAVASDEMIAQLNSAIARGRLKDRADRTLTARLGGGLLRPDQAVLYPIIDDIYMMLVDDGIPLDQPGLKS